MNNETDHEESAVLHLRNEAGHINAWSLFTVYAKTYTQRAYNIFKMIIKIHLIPPANSIVTIFCGSSKKFVAGFDKCAYFLLAHRRCKS